MGFLKRLLWGPDADRADREAYRMAVAMYEYLHQQVELGMDRDDAVADTIEEMSVAIHRLVRSGMMGRSYLRFMRSLETAMVMKQMPADIARRVCKTINQRVMVEMPG